MFKRYLTGGILFLMFSTSMAGMEGADDNAVHLASFDYVWTTLRDKYYDAEMGGHHWQTVYDTLRPKVEAAQSIDDVRHVLRSMLNLFGESHFGIIPGDIYKDMDPAQEVSEDRASNDYTGYPGFDVRLIGHQMVITRVDAGSPADSAGIQTGWILTRIKDDTLAKKLPVLMHEFEKSTMQKLIIYAHVKYKLLGPVGKAVETGFLNAKNESVSLELIRIPQKGKPFQFGYLPETYIWMDVDTLNEDVGYIGFNGFMDPIRLMSVFNGAMKDFLNMQGVIIDLRGNTGGIGAMAMGMAGWFVKERNKSLGTLTLRSAELRLVINPRPQLFQGKLIVLIDALSASAAEFMAGGLQDLGCAVLIGEQTAGAALPSAIERLPNGDGFQYVFANYVSAGGHKLEGDGVIPDVSVLPDRLDYLNGKDVVLDKAVEFISN